MQVYRGEIYFVDIGFGVGSEQSGRRPGIIIGNDIGNKHSPVVEVVYTTCSRKRPMPTHVKIQSSKRSCTVLCEQIDTISKERIQDRIGKVTDQEMQLIEAALLVSLGIEKEEEGNVGKVEKKYISSLEVADMVEKDHKELLRDIRRYCEQLGQSNIALSDFFAESTYHTAQNKRVPCYNVTKKGCELISHKLTGVKGTEFTAKYIHRFHDMEETIQHGFELSQLSPELQAIFAHDKKIQSVMEHMENHESRIDCLETTMTVDYGQQKKLNDTHHTTAITVLGGKNAQAYGERIVREKTFRSIWKDYKDFFKIPSYKDTPTARFEEALDYLKKWKPDTNLALEINFYLQ